jgi:GWxTD domain-containing protein
MIAIRAIALFILLSALALPDGHAQGPIVNKNTAYRYNLNLDIRFDHQLYYFPDSALLVFTVTYNDNGASPGQYDLGYTILQGYDSENVLHRDSITSARHLKASSEGKYYYELGLPYRPDFEVLVLQARKKGSNTGYLYDIFLDRGYNASLANLILREGDGGIPNLGGFIRSGQEVRISTLEGVPQRLYAYFYSRDFPEALPPMVTEERTVSRDLTIDSVFSFSSDEKITFSRPGLYFIQRDTASLEGLGFRVENSYYPLVRTFDQLINPLIYISTGDETRTLRATADLRKAFEDHWLDVCGNEELAARTLRRYYESVAEANYLFTSFKEGWKTDMGMIYIVHGVPDEVYANEETIDWVYNSDISIPSVRYSFYKVNTLFSNKHYTLLRRKNYDRGWFRSVELWRNGRK